MTLDQIKFEYMKDVDITIENCLDKALMIPALKAKWISLYRQHIISLRKLEEQRDKTFHEKQKYMAGRAKVQFTDTEIERIKVSADNDLGIFDSQIRDAKDKVEHLKLLVDAIMFIGPDVKNMIESRKLEEM